MSKILPKRKSPRAQWIEYNAGLYFITICTHNWVHYFGEIKFGKIYLIELGEYLDKTLQGASNHNNYINILQYVIMPNHLHAIVEVEYEEYSDRACSVRESNIDTTSKKDLTTLIFVNLKFINTFASRDVGLPRPKKIINKSNNNLIVEHPLRKRAGVRIKKFAYEIKRII